MKRKPEWLRVRLSDTPKYNSVNEVIKSHKLHTVCQGANCPNRVTCFSNKTATFMILGEFCTRNCSFCNIDRGPLCEPDLTEPERVAKGVKELGLSHAVITSVTRDDLRDGGASVFAETIRQIKRYAPETSIEVLVPDFGGDGDALALVIEAGPEVINHNVETVPSLYYKVRPMADYQQSLKLLSEVKKMAPGMITKSGIMLGLGESLEEVYDVLGDLRGAQVDLVTIGQYLQPSPRHIEMVDYIRPELFHEIGEKAKEMGFVGVASGPLVRSSYNAKVMLDSMAD